MKFPVSETVWLLFQQNLQNLLVSWNFTAWSYYQILSITSDYIYLSLLKGALLPVHLCMDILCGRGFSMLVF